MRIAVRNTVKPREAQIYNWGIKREGTSLDGVGHLPKGSNSADVSSDVSSTATKSGGTPSAGKAKITIINKGSAHPYHLVTEDWSSTHVWGWVDEGSFS